MFADGFKGFLLETVLVKISGADVLYTVDEFYTVSSVFNTFQTFIKDFQENAETKREIYTLS